MTECIARSQFEFESFVTEFARELRTGDVVALGGPLGSGKTTFVRAAVRALHNDDPATSPTFTFWHRYVKEGSVPIDHLDLYRVEDPSELAELGLEEAFGGDSIVFVEWWEHAPGLLPARRIEVAIEGAGDAPRTIRVERTSR
jgi:tRNA threonylcarbamoyl adenosine modification protein YjeE